MKVNFSFAPRSRLATTIAICFAVAVLEGFDLQALGVAAPKLATELRLSPAEMGWLFAISNIGLAAGASLGGWYADVIGRKPVLIVSVVLFGVFTLLTSVTHVFSMLFAVRLLAGFGFGGAIPNMMAIAIDISPANKRSSSAAAIFCGLPLGGGLCALVTQVLPANFNWRLVFVIGGLLPALVAPAIHWFLPETLNASNGDSEERVSLAIALFGGGRTAPTLLLWLSFIPTLLILYLFVNWLPTLVAAKGFAKSVAPQASLAFNFASVAGALWIGRVVDRFGTRWPLLIAYMALLASTVALGAANTFTATLLLSGTAGFCLLGASYSLYGVAAAYYPARVRGKGSGASVTAGRLGSIVGPLMAGLLLGAGMTATTLIYWMAPIALAAGVAVFVLSYFPTQQ